MCWRCGSEMTSGPGIAYAKCGDCGWILSLSVLVAFLRYNGVAVCGGEDGKVFIQLNLAQTLGYPRA